MAGEWQQNQGCYKHEQGEEADVGDEEIEDVKEE